jgi:hypothetical protein
MSTRYTRYMPYARIFAAFLMTLIPWGGHGHNTVTADLASQTAVYTVSVADTRPSDCPPSEEKPSKRSPRTGWGRDPFQHPSEKSISPYGMASNGPRLVGIVSGSQGRMAIFGHSILRKGDMVGNEMIVDIDQNRVTLTHEGLKRVVAMREAR